MRVQILSEAPCGHGILVVALAFQANEVRFDSDWPLHYKKAISLIDIILSLVGEVAFELFVGACGLAAIFVAMYILRMFLFVPPQK